MPAGRVRHYAWTVLALCFVAILFAQGLRLGFGAFVRPWEEEFGVSRGTITLIGSLSFLVYGGAQPFVGRAVDVHGIRRTLVVSTLLVAAGLALSAAAQTPWQLALTYGVVASLGFGGASGVAASVAVTYWFTQRRGLAFGLVEAGFGAGQLILVPIALATIPQVGWRAAMLGAAVLLTVGVAPILWRYLRDRPEDVGQLPIGGPLPPAQIAGAGAGAGRGDVEGARGLLRSRAFWGLGIPFFVCGITTTGLIDTHLIPLAQDRGIGAATTGLAVALLAAANVTGILASGPLADRVDNRLLLFGLYATRGALAARAADVRRRPRADPLRDPLRARRLLHRRADPVAGGALRVAAHRRARVRLPQRRSISSAPRSARGSRRSSTTRRAPTTARCRLGGGARRRGADLPHAAPAASAGGAGRLARVSGRGEG